VQTELTNATNATTSSVAKEAADRAQIAADEAVKAKADGDKAKSDIDSAISKYVDDFMTEAVKQVTSTQTVNTILANKAVEDAKNAQAIVQKLEIQEVDEQKERSSTMSQAYAIQLDVLQIYHNVNDTVSPHVTTNNQTIMGFRTNIQNLIDYVSKLSQTEPIITTDNTLQSSVNTTLSALNSLFSNLDIHVTESQNTLNIVNTSLTIITPAVGVVQSQYNIINNSNTTIQDLRYAYTILTTTYNTVTSANNDANNATNRSDIAINSATPINQQAISIVQTLQKQIADQKTLTTQTSQESLQNTQLSTLTKTRVDACKPYQYSPFTMYDPYNPTNPVSQECHNLIWNTYCPTTPPTDPGYAPFSLQQLIDDTYAYASSTNPDIYKRCYGVFSRPDIIKSKVSTSTYLYPSSDTSTYYSWWNNSSSTPTTQTNTPTTTSTQQPSFPCQNYTDYTTNISQTCHNTMWKYYCKTTPPDHTQIPEYNNFTLSQIHDDTYNYSSFDPAVYPTVTQRCYGDLNRQMKPKLSLDQLRALVEQ